MPTWISLFSNIFSNQYHSFQNYYLTIDAFRTFTYLHKYLLIWTWCVFYLNTFLRNSSWLCMYGLYTKLHTCWIVMQREREVGNWSQSRNLFVCDGNDRFTGHYQPHKEHVYTEKTRFPFPFKFNGIRSWWRFFFRFWTKWNSIWFKIERKNVTTIIFLSIWK